ncbi:MAG: DHHA1 domain-containing protein [Nanoarchaeota archaeon]|nr:DHHA1 domain-containing protein [Nanoarchaeota archaeon]
MIPESELEEIRKELKLAKRPLFLHDDDPDGLSSYLILQKYIGRGKGMLFSHQNSPELAHTFIRIIESENPDLIVILDIAKTSEEFIDELPCKVIHLDHHYPLKLTSKNYKYYNPRVHNDEDARPTCYWAYKITQENMWMSMIGCIADWHIPEFAEEFNKKYPGLLPEKYTSPGDIYFDSKLGDLSKSFTFLLKGTRHSVQKNIDALSKINDPFEILNETTESGKLIYKQFIKINKAYKSLLKDALDSHEELHNKNHKIFLYNYVPMDYSFSSLLSTELIFRFPDKVIIIARVKDGTTILSLRSKTIKLPDKIKRALEGLHGHGGGHDYACGTGVKSSDFPIFIQRMTDMINEELEK